MISYPLNRRPCGPQGRSGSANILYRSPDCPPRAPSLYRLSYPTHPLFSQRCKLHLLLSQSCLLNTTFRQISFPSTNSSIPSHLRHFALLQFARALQSQEGARLALFQISCYSGCSVVICVVLLLFILFCSYVC